jgi:hypothetical protein
MNILDIGCGTGDVISLFVGEGVCRVTAIDFSQGVIADTAKRFQKYAKTMTFVAASIQNAAIPSAAFDLVTCINVLQHILDENDFQRAVENMVLSLKPGGYLLLMEFACRDQKSNMPAPYVIIRPLNTYINQFQRMGCELACETGLPRFGVRLYRMFAKLIKTVGSRGVDGGNGAQQKRGKAAQYKNKLQNLVKHAVLLTTLPLDRFLLPFPVRYTDMSIFIFRRNVNQQFTTAL